MSIWLLFYLASAAAAILSAWIPNKWLVIVAILIIDAALVLQSGLVHG